MPTLWLAGTRTLLPVKSSTHMKQVGFILIKIALTAAVMLAVASTFDFRTALQLLTTLSWSTIAACVTIQLCQCWIAGARLQTVMSLAGSTLPTAALTKITLQSVFFNQAFVSFIGGDAYRIWRIHAAGIPMAQATSAIILDRILGVFGNHLALVVLLPWVIPHVDSEGVRFALLLLAAGGTAGIALVLALGLAARRMVLRSLLPKSWRTNRLATTLLEFATIGRYVLENPRSNIKIGSLSVLLALMNCFLFYLILRNLEVSTNLALHCTLLVPAVLEIALLPVSVAGWGLREGVAIISFGAVGLQPGTGLATSAAFGFISLAVGLVGGLLWLTDRPPRRPTSQGPSQV